MRRFYLVECTEHRSGDITSRILGEMILTSVESAKLIEKALNELARMEGKHDKCYFYVSDDKVRRIM